MTLQIVILVMVVVVGNDDDDDDGDDDKLHVTLFSILHKIDIRLYFFLHIFSFSNLQSHFFFGSEKKIRI